MTARPSAFLRRRALFTTLWLASFAQHHRALCIWMMMQMTRNHPHQIKWLREYLRGLIVAKLALQHLLG